MSMQKLAKTKLLCNRLYNNIKIGIDKYRKVCYNPRID